MRIAERYENGMAVVDLAGAIRGPAAAAVTDSVRRLLDAGHRVIVLNLADVAAVDATGLGALWEASTASRASGGVLRLARVAERLSDLVVLTRLLTAFETFDSVEQALEDGAARSASASAQELAPSGAFGAVRYGRA